MVCLRKLSASSQFPLSSTSSISSQLRAPLLWLVIPWFSGILLAPYIPRFDSLSFVFAGGVLTVLVAMMLCWSSHWRLSWAVLYISAALIISVGIQQSRIESNQTVGRFTGFPARELNLVLEVREVTQLVPVEEVGIVGFVAMVKEGLFGSFSDIRGDALRCYLRKPVGVELRSGDVIQARAVLYPNRGRIHLPYVFRNGVVLKVLEAGAERIRMGRNELRSKVVEILEVGSANERGCSGIVKSILLGEKRYLQKQDKKLFQLVGVMHFLAISGFHLSAIAWVIYTVCKWIGIANVQAKLSTVVLCYGYIWLVGYPVSAQRAWFMLLFFFSAQLFRRKCDLLALTVAAAWFIVLWNPDELYELGFQLSFGVVLGIVSFALPFQRWLLGIRSEQDLLPVDVSGERIYLRIRRKLWFYTISSFAVSWSAFWVSLPLVFGCFGGIPFVAVFLNPILAPLFVLVLLLGGVSVAVGMLGVVWLSSWINQLSWLCLSLVVKLCEYGSMLPLSYVGEEGNSLVTYSSFVVMLFILLTVNFRLGRRAWVFLLIPFWSAFSVLVQFVFV